MQDTVFIYSLNCPITGAPRYVGKTNDPQGRFHSHISRLSEKNHKTSWIKSLISVGLLPDMEILRKVSKISWQQHERELIGAFRATGFSLTNGTDGGDSGPDSEEVREKLRIAAIGNTNRRGKRHPQESIEKIKKSLLGNKHTFGKALSIEHREKVRISLIGNQRFLGHQHSPVARERMSKSHIGIPWSPAHRLARKKN